MPPALSWVGVAYMAVLAAELIGDRSLVTIGVLASRFGSWPVLSGVFPAFMGKALAAVLLGGLLTGLPRTALAVVSAVTFALAALVLWREHRTEPAEGAAPWPRWPPTVAAFGSVFCSEWADPGQLAAAALAVRSHAPFSVWLGATLALCTKGVLAVVAGRQVGRRIPTRVLRGTAVMLCVGMGVLALLASD